MRTQLGSSKLALFVQNRSAKSHSRPTAPKFAHQAQHPTCLGGFVGVAYFFRGPRDGVSMSISPRVWCWPGTGPALWVLPSNSSPKFRPTRRKCTSQTEKSTSQFGLKGLFLGTGGTQRCPPRDFFVSHHRGAPPMPNPSPPCKTGRAGVWPTGACSGHNWGLRMRPQSPPGALNTEMWLGAQLFFSSRFTRGARYGKWARCVCLPTCIWYSTSPVSPIGR